MSYDFVGNLMPSIEQQVIAIVSENVANGIDVTRESNLQQQLMFDDLDHLEVIIELEAVYHIEISDEDGDESVIKTVSDFIRLVEERRPDLVEKVQGCEDQPKIA